MKKKIDRHITLDADEVAQAIIDWLSKKGQPFPKDLDAVGFVGGSDFYATVAWTEETEA